VSILFFLSSAGNIVIPDFLNQICSSFTRHARAYPSSNDELYSRTQAGHARLAAKYVFSRQYGLSNPFNTKVQSKQNNAYRDNLDKENEIKV